jgi:hypothetical protein
MPRLSRDASDPSSKAKLVKLIEELISQINANQIGTKETAPASGAS